MTGFIARQIDQIRQGGGAELWRRIKLAKPILLGLPLYVLATPAVVVIRLMKPWLIVRLGSLTSTSIGHFAANTELYFCERDAGINMPMQRSIDFFYLRKPICNKQLTIMWKRVLRIWPAWFLGLVDGANRLIPGGAVHEIGNNTQNDRDVHNLLDQFEPHLQFTIEEEARGEAGLRAMGIPSGTPFICLTVRDSAYLTAHLRDGDYSYHNYRDSDIQNYVLAAEELANRYYVIEWGQGHAAINSSHPRSSFATNGMRSDFMDIYLVRSACSAFR